MTEELGELDRAIEAGDAAAIEEEMGDVLFALVNLSRHVKVDAEGALRRTIDKFTTRFAHVEARVKSEHGGWGGAERRPAENLPLEVLDRYWEEAKQRPALPQKAESSDRNTDMAVRRFATQPQHAAPEPLARTPEEWAQRGRPPGRARVPRQAGLPLDPGARRADPTRNE